MHPPSPNLRSGSCCTTRLCQPCCGSGWRRGTFINRWPRSLHRVKTLTRLRALNSPYWGKHRCPRNPSQPWMPLILFFGLFLIASCVPLEAKDSSLRSYLLSYFIFLYIHNLTEVEIYCHSRFIHSHFDERSLLMSKNTNTPTIDILCLKGPAPDPWVLYCIVYFMCRALYID